MIYENMAKKETLKEINLSNKIILRSVRGKVGQVIKIEPCKDPNTSEYPDCVKKVDSNNDMILSEAERNDPNRKYFIKETDVFDVVDGTTFDLDDVRQRFIWEAIKNCPLIAPDYYAKDINGNSLINGTGPNSTRPRFGVAELFIEKPGEDSVRRVSKKKQIHDAEDFIWNDKRGYDGRVLMAKLLGHEMQGLPDADVTDYLIQIAEKNPEKIINLYTGGETSIRLLFIEARNKHVIVYKNKLYIYADNVVLGANDEAAILFLKDPKNVNVLNLIKKETFPELTKEDEK